MEAIGYFRQRPGAERNEALVTLPESEAGFFAYCETQGFQPVATFIDGSSAVGDFERGYGQLCDFLRQPGRGFTTVVVSTIADLAERPTEAVRRLVELEYLGAKVLVTEAEDLDPMEGAVAAWKARRGHEALSRRAMDALKTKAMRGYGLGKTPYGYRIGDGGRLEIVPDEAKVVSEIFRMYVDDGIGLRLIARKLNDAATATRRGSRWSVVTVRDILRNRTYTGTYARFGVRVPGNHTPIVTMEVFRAAQLKRESSKGPRGAPRERVFALSGLGTCGYCGGRMIGVSRKQAWSRKRDGGRTEAEYRYYRCGSRVNQSVCGYHTWRADVLERQVVDELNERLAGAEAWVPNRTRTELRASVSGRLRLVEARMERQLEAASRKAPAPDRIRMAVRPLVREVRRLEKQIRALDGTTGRAALEQSWAELQRAVMRDLRESWEQLTGEERRFYLADLLERITVYDGHVELSLIAG